MMIPGRVVHSSYYYFFLNFDLLEKIGFCFKVLSLYLHVFSCSLTYACLGMAK